MGDYYLAKRRKKLDYPNGKYPADTYFGDSLILHSRKKGNQLAIKCFYLEEEKGWRKGLPIGPKRKPKMGNYRAILEPTNNLLIFKM